VIVSKLKKMPLTFSLRECVPLKTVFDRIMPSVGAPDLAALRLDADMRNPRLRPVVVYIAADKKHMVTWLNPSDWAKWRHVRALAGDVTLEPPVNGYCLVPCVDCDKCYPIAAPPTTTSKHDADDTRPPERRRGPVLKHDWLAICGEIARRCINPKTRLLEIPKNERKLAQDMLGWCQEKYEKEPADSEMREAVKAICAALRAHK
jgi:hypothetical protein